MARSRRNQRYDDYDDDYDYEDNDSQLEDLLRENKRLKAKNQSLQQKNQKLFRDCQSFAQQLDKIQKSGVLSSAKDWKQQSQDYQNQIASLKKRVRSLKSENTQLQDKLDDLSDTIPDVGGNADVNDYLNPSGFDEDEDIPSKKDNFTRSKKQDLKSKSSDEDSNHDDDDFESADEDDIPIRRRADSVSQINRLNYRRNRSPEQIRNQARIRNEEDGFDEEEPFDTVGSTEKPKNTPARTFWRVIVGILLVLVVLIDIGVTALYVMDKRQGQMEVAGYGITTVDNALTSNGDTVALPSDLLITNNKSRYEECVGGNYIVTKDHQVAEVTGWTNVGKTIEATENGATVQINKSQYFGKLSQRIENLGTLFKFTEKNPALAFGILALLTVFLIFIFMLLSPKRRKIKS